MVSSKVELCNHALSYLGESRISSLDDANERARICNALYGQTRDELLADFEWPFAISRRALSSVEEENLTEFDYRYALPADYLRLLDVLDSKTYQEKENYRVKQFDYAIEGNRLLTDLTPCYVKYIRRIEEPNTYPEAFVQAFALTLAAKVSPRLSQNMSLTAQMAQASAGAILLAKTQLTQVSMPKPTRTAMWSEVN